MDNQSLSDRHKETVRNWVPKLRVLLEEDFKAQLGRLGFQRNGKHTPEENLSLPAEDLSIRRRIAALLERDIVSEGKHPQRGFDSVVREFTYTYLNRLVGLKAMECRQLLFLRPPGEPIAEAEQTEVITPLPGQAYSRFLRDFRTAGGSRYKYEDDAEEALFRDGLTEAFRQVTADIRLLFDPEHEYAILWPTHGTLTKLLQAINRDLPAEAYQAPDFLGWVYQFFNRDEKKKVRDENKGTPRSSYELSVINQFYTPSWVVKVLVDNTLGRLWLQMHPDSSLKRNGPPPLPQDRQAEQPYADYIVPRTGERIRYRALNEAGNWEAFKPAKEIRLLDPACGTMHFGQYAFGLFQQMYLDEIEHAGEPGWPAEPSVARMADIPAAIIENNLYGIDIDPRAIQIASLSLLLTAKEAGALLGVSPSEVHIRHSNLAIANAVPMDDEALRELIDQVATGHKKDLKEKLFKSLSLNLRNVGELGSLIQVHEGVREALESWVNEQAKVKGLTKGTSFLLDSGPQMELGGGDLSDDVLQQRVLRFQKEKADLESEANALLSELHSGLQYLAAKADTDPRQRLFAEDTDRGLKLLDILSHEFDAIVMNPPYGAFAKISGEQADKQFKQFIKASYPCGYQDIYAAFIERATQLITHEGYIGALVNSTFKTNKSHQSLREEILLKRNPLVIMLDLGFGILDGATVEAAALTLRGGAL
jgi:hypothetical protein